MGDAKPGNRNYCLDFVKGIACICVVFMHCEFPGRLGILIQCVSRFCVPFFFMVSGYFCYKESGKTDYIKKIKHIGIITLFASLLYLVLVPIWGNAEEVELTARGVFGILIKWIVFNKPYFIAGQLWFLFALLYDYILFAIVDKFKLHKIAFIFIPIGIILYISLAQGAHLIGFSVPNYIYRNFLIEGFPLFSLGYFIHKHQNRIHISNLVLILCIGISTLLCPVERLTMGRDFGVNIVSFIQVISLFVFCVKKPDMGKNKWIYPVTWFGCFCSMYVYIVHPAVWHLLEKLYSILKIDNNLIALFALPLLCVTITIIISLLVVKLTSFLKNVKTKKA